MSSQVISYRLSDEELSALKPHQLSGESLNQTAQRLMRDKFGFPTPQLNTGLSHQEIVDIVDNRLADTFSQIETRLSILERNASVGNSIPNVSQLETFNVEESAQSEAPSDIEEELPIIEVQSNIDNLESILLEARDEVLSKWKVVKRTETKERISIALNKLIDAIIKK